MTSIHNKLIKKENIPFAVFAFFMFMIHTRIGLVEGSDDTFYRAIFSEGQYQVLTQNNRVLINTLMAIFFQLNIWVWRIINVLIFTTLLFKISELACITNNKYKLIINSCICSSVMYVHINVLSSGAYWISGSFNYLWSFTFCIISIIPLKNILFNLNNTNKLLILSSLAVIYSCNIEQTSGILIIFGIVVLSYIKFIEKRKLPINIVIYYIFILINVMIMLLLPFNKVRYKGDIMAWYPNYKMLSLTDKLYQGMAHLSNHIVKNSSIFMLIITLLIVVILYNKYEDKFIRILGLIPFIYFLKVIIKEPININSYINELFFNFDKKNFNQIHGFLDYLPIITSISILLFIIVLLWFIYEDNKQKLYIILLYLLALGAGGIVSFSPSIFASGNRVFFATDFIMILIIAFLFNTLIKDTNVKAKSFRDSIAIISVVSMILAVITMVHYVGSVVYY